MVYKINSHVTKETGSALQRFFGRTIQTYLPELVKKTFDQAAAIKKRSEQQLAIANKLGRRSADKFKTGDLVVCQNTTTGKWTVRGRIIKARTADDGSVRTFEVKTETGNVTLRNSRYLRHQTKKKDVSFAMDEARPDEAAENGESSKSDSSTHDTSDSSVTMPMPEPRRVSERLARRENRF